MDINKWAAEQCDITVRGLDARYAIPQYSFIYNDKVFYYEWTMQDARCRELVREHFGISTTSLGSCGLWDCCVPRKGHVIDQGARDTIKEAEIACLEAIMKADE